MSIHDTLGGLPGKRLETVHYVVLPESPEPEQRRSAACDEVELEVILVFDGEPVSISWEMRNELECLCVRPRVTRNYIAGSSKKIDMTGQPAWRECIGAEVVSARTAWHRPARDEDACPWALSLGFRGGGSIAVALGELIGGRPSYLPDSLIVLFGNDAGASYRIAGSPTSAWGEDTGPGDA